jgi:hypothetical protein
MKKWLLKNQPQEVASFLPLVQPSLEMAPQLAATRALQVSIVQPALEMTLETTHIHLTRLVGVVLKQKAKCFGATYTMYMRELRWLN